MQDAKSVNPNMKFTPNQRTVVCPPAKIYRYSMYDELKLGEDKYKEFRNSLADPNANINKIKRENLAKQIFGIALIAGLAILGYKNSNSLSKFFKKIQKFFS